MISPLNPPTTLPRRTKPLLYKESHFDFFRSK